MEPTFKKEDINQSRLLQLSIHDDDSKMDSEHDHTVDSDNNESVVEKLEDTLKDVEDSRNDNHSTIGDNNQTNETYDVFNISKVKGKSNETLDASHVIDDCNKNESIRGTYFVNKSDINGQTLDKSNSKIRGTYFVRNSVMSNTSNSDYSVKENEDDSKNISIDSDKSNTNINSQTVKKNLKLSRASEIFSAQFEELEMATNSRNIKATDTVDISLKATDAGNVSFAQFEQIETATNTDQLKTTHADDVVATQFKQSKMATDTRYFKASNNTSDVSLTQFEQIEKATNTGQLQTTHANDVATTQFKQSKMATYTRDFTSTGSDVSLAQFEQIETASNTGQLKTTHANDVSPTRFKESKIATNSRFFKASKASDVSLAEFERLELAANSKKQSIVKDTTELLSNIKIARQNRNFFDQKKDVGLIQVNLNKDKTFFNIVVNNDNKLEESKKVLLDDRSPSIVKEDIGNYEPSTIKKLLGESFSRSDIVSSVHNNLVVPISKKQASVDFFEDSPIVFKIKDSTPLKTCNSDSELFSKPTEKRKFFDSMLRENSEAAGPNLNAGKIDNAKDKSVSNGVKNTDDEVFVKPKIITTFTENSNTPWKENLSILETSIEKFDKEIEVTLKSIEQIVLDKTDSKSKCVTAKEKSIINLNETADIHTKMPNSIDEFEILYNNITVPRATEFDLLVSQNSTMLNETHHREDPEKPKYNLRHKGNTSLDKKEQKDKSMDKKEKMETEEILLESRACESKAKLPKRNLRLRRRKNDDDSTDQEKEKTEHEKNNPKLQDIINLQKEFSDVTMGAPASKKEIKDIQSPEKKEEDENNPPFGIQSCPTKR